MASKYPCPDSNEIMEYFPTELLQIIFMRLSAKDLATCQQVCGRWRRIIDFYFKDESYWRRQIDNDFPNLCEAVLQKCRPNLPFNNIYKSLSLWPKLNQATEVSTNFACPTTAQAEIKGFIILKHNVIAVHTHGGIYYWNLNTLCPMPRGPVYGNFLKYYEGDNIVVLLGFTLNLYVILPTATEPLKYYEVRFNRVRTFLVYNRIVYIVFSDDEITLCELFPPKFEVRTVQKMHDRVVALGYSDGHLNILTYKRNLYFLTNNQVVFERALDIHCNMLEVLKRYNFLDNIDWTSFFQWVFVIHNNICRSPLQDITIVKQYGDLLFVGTLWGIVRIYYKPYVNGELNIFKSKPLKEYNFLKTFCLSFPACPVVAIDVIEDHGSHRLYIGMPKGICLIQYTHTSTEQPTDFRVVEM